MQGGVLVAVLSPVVVHLGTCGPATSGPGRRLALLELLDLASPSLEILRRRALGRISRGSMGPLGNLVLLHPLSCPSYFYRARPPFSSLGHPEPRCEDHSERQDPSPLVRALKTRLSQRERDYKGPGGAMMEGDVTLILYF